MNLQEEYDVSVVLPCFQEEEQVINGASEIHKIMCETKYSFEIIFIDDGSTDNTRDKILEAAKKFTEIKYIFRNENGGRGISFADGVNLARGKYIGFLDIDLEISCKYLPEVILELEKGNDISIVKRSYDNSMNPVFIVRQAASYFYRLLVRTMLHLPPLDTETGFKFFKRACIFSLLEKVQSGRWFFDTEIVALAHKQGFKISEVPGKCVRLPNKKSNVRLLPDSIKQFSQLLKFRRRLTKIQSFPK